MVARKPGAGDPRLEAAALAAEAERARELVGRGPGQRIVSPLAGDAVWPHAHLPIHSNPAAASCAQNHREDQPRASRRSVGRLGDGQAVGVVGAAHGPRQRSRKVALQRLAVQPRRVGILHQPGGAHNRSRNPHAHRGRFARAAADAPLQLLHHLCNRPHRGRVVVLRRRNAQPRNLRAAPIQREPFDLGAAQVDSDANPFCHTPP